MITYQTFDKVIGDFEKLHKLIEDRGSEKCRAFRAQGNIVFFDMSEFLNGIKKEKPNPWLLTKKELMMSDADWKNHYLSLNVR